MRSESPPVLTSNFKLYCTGCGTCAGICPAECLTMTLESDGVYRPDKVEDLACIDCGKCACVCPGVDWDLPEKNRVIYPGTIMKETLGRFIACYAGFAANETIRVNSSSGGIVTAILVDLLEKNTIDGAIVVGAGLIHPLRPEMYIARAKEEILRASKSKYAPVHLENAIKSLRTHPEEQYALVGLPCHIQGIRKAQGAGLIKAEQIVVTLGLLCGHGASINLTKFIMKKYHVQEAKVTRMDYRAGGWPSFGYLFETADTKTFVPSRGSILGTAWIHNFFTPKRCLVCADLTAESADLSFGDAWLPKFTDCKSDQKGGWSVIIGRNPGATKYLEELHERGILNLEPISAEDVERSQSVALVSKKTLSGIRRPILYKSTRRSEGPLSFLLRPYLKALSQCLHVRLALYLNQRGLLVRIPAWPLELYFQVLSRLGLA
jgi:coenzyme F420 hydrogenase subunit beta